MPRLNLIAFAKHSQGVMVWVTDQLGWDDTYSLDQFVRLSVNGNVVTGAPQGVQTVGGSFPTLNSPILFVGVTGGAATLQYRQNVQVGWSDMAINIPSQNETMVQGVGTFGRFNVKNRGTDKFLRPSSNVAGAAIEAVSNSDGNTEWFLEGIGGDVFKLVHVSSGLVAGIRNASDSSGTAIELQGFTDAVHQKIKIEHNNNFKGVRLVFELGSKRVGIVSNDALVLTVNPNSFGTATSFDFEAVTSNASVGGGGSNVSAPSTPVLSLISGTQGQGNDSSVTLGWTYSGSDVTHFTIERSDFGTPGSWNDYSGNRPSTQREFTQGGLWESSNNNAPFFYRIIAVNSAGTATSNVVEVPINYLSTAQSVPAAPVLSVGAITPSSVVLSWAAVSGATSYKLFQSSTSAVAGFSQVGGNLTGQSITVTGLNPNTQYWFRLKATNTIGDSGNSTTVSATTTQNTSNQTTGIPIIKPNTGNKIRRQQYEIRGESEPNASVQVEIGNNVTTVTANAQGNWQFNPTAWISSSVLSIRARATSAGKNTSEWSATLALSDGDATDEWAMVFQNGLNFRAHVVTFSGTPSNPTNIVKGAAIADNRTSQQAAQQDIIVYFDSDTPVIIPITGGNETAVLSLNGAIAQGNDSSVVVAWTYAGTAATGFNVQMKDSANGAWQNSNTTVLGSSARTHTVGPGIWEGYPAWFRLQINTAAGALYSNEIAMSASYITEAGASNQIAKTLLILYDWEQDGSGAPQYAATVNGSVVASPTNGYWRTQPNEAPPAANLVVKDWPYMRQRIENAKALGLDSFTFQVRWELSQYGADGNFDFRIYVWLMNYAQQQGMKIAPKLNVTRNVYTTANSWSYELADREIAPNGSLHEDAYGASILAWGSSKWSNINAWVAAFAAAAAPYKSNILYITGAANDTAEWEFKSTLDGVAHSATQAAYNTWFSQQGWGTAPTLGSTTAANSENKRRAAKFHSYIKNLRWKAISGILKQGMSGVKTVLHVGSFTNNVLSRGNTTAIPDIGNNEDGLKQNPDYGYNAAIATKFIAKAGKMAIIEETKNPNLDVAAFANRVREDIDNGATAITFSFFDSSYVNSDRWQFLVDVKTILVTSGHWTKTRQPIQNPGNTTVINVNASAAVANGGDYEAAVATAFNASKAANNGISPTINVIDDL